MNTTTYQLGWQMKAVWAAWGALMVTACGAPDTNQDNPAAVEAAGQEDLALLADEQPRENSRDAMVARMQKPQRTFIPRMDNPDPGFRGAVPVRCVPYTCDLNACGEMPDGCGGTIACGGCAFPTTCGGGGVDNVCGGGVTQVQFTTLGHAALGLGPRGMALHVPQEGEGLVLLAGVYGASTVTRTHVQPNGDMGATQVENVFPAVGTVASADLDGDGVADEVLAHDGANAVTLVWTAQRVRQTLQLAGAPRSVVAAQLDDVAGQEVIITTTTGRILLLRAGPERVGAATQELFMQGYQQMTVALEDMDADGMSDVLVADPYNWAVHYFRAKGAGAFNVPVMLWSDHEPRVVAAADINGDGLLDVVTGGSTAASWFAGVNGAAPAETPSGMMEFPAALMAMTGADLDGNGRKDLVVTCGDGSLHLYRDGSTAPAMSLHAGSNPVAVDTADLDQDGRLDLAVLNAAGGEVHFLRNQSW